MFHGTDASLLDISKTERSRLNQACETIINKLFELYKANSITYLDKRLEQSRDRYGCSSTAYVFAEARINESALYSYRDSYVTNNPERAIIYSREAWIFGETGWIVNRLVEGAYALILDLPDDAAFHEAFSLFEARKQREKKTGNPYDYKCLFFRTLYRKRNWIDGIRTGKLFERH